MHTILKRQPVFFYRIAVYCLVLGISFPLFTQERSELPVEVPAEVAAEAITGTEDSVQGSGHTYRIIDVHYDIKGWTKVYPLSRAVPIDRTRIFESQEALEAYLAVIVQELHNIRSIATAECTPSYGTASDGEPIPVSLTVKAADTWNFIAVPYPSFDSNHGFRFKVKLQDFNFFGSLQPLKSEIMYQTSETGSNLFSSGIRFTYPFQANMFHMEWSTNAEIISAFDKYPKITIGTGLLAGYTYKNISFYFGVAPEVVINDRDNAADAGSQLSIPPLGSSESTGSESTAIDDGLGALYPQDSYYFRTKFYFFTPIVITRIKNFGVLQWTPYIDIKGNWAFDGIQADKLKPWSLNWQHSLTLGHIDWFENFRQGLTFSFDNSYSYQLKEQSKVDISFGSTLTGFYSFVNRVGLYGRAQLFYNLHNVKTDRAGIALRGILNKRLLTDTAFTFNFDIPIRVATFDFEDITGVSWTRFFNCDVQLVPFFDMALVHDTVSGRYYHPADGWYTGGFEVIVFPQKMRSIYVRASLGVDLTELKNVPGLNKLKGKAKRDGHGISEIFIGIGVHY